jgi:radical SAM protein with 4Fe4S-binding SPASM domain
VNWVDLTGGEIFLRPDIDDIFEAVVSGWARLALLHFPTNGFQTDRIVASVTRLARLPGPARRIVTVSLDGDAALNDEIRGIKGGFGRQIETFRQLRRVPGIDAALGMTLSTFNLGRFDETFAACVREIPDLTVDDVHLNVAQQSGHYYGNAQSGGFVPSPAEAEAELAHYRSRRGPVRSPQQWLEARYLTHMETFLRTARTPMPCHALRASCFIDPWGVVYPCITYSRPMGRLRDTGMRLEPIWNAASTAAVQAEIWNGQCPQCWTACEAYQSILGNLLAGRTQPPAGETSARAPAVTTEAAR